MIVIFDTNQFRQQWWQELENLAWVQYRVGSTELNFATRLPDPVVIELLDRASSNYVKIIANLKKQVDKIRSEFGLLLPENMILNTTLAMSDNLPATFNEEAFQTAEQALITRLHNLIGNFQRIEIPHVQHTDLIRRILRRKRPFKNKDMDQGYRDALIWNCVLAALEAEHATANPKTVVFVSANTDDFSSEDNNSVLHADLLEDIENRGIPPERLVFLQNLNAFNLQYVDPHLPTTEHVDTILEERELNLEELIRSRSQMLQDKLTEELEQLFDFSPFDGCDRDGPDIDYFEIQNFSRDITRQFAPTTLLFRATLRCEFAFSFLTEKWCCWNNTDGTIWEDLGSPWDEHYVNIEMGGYCEMKISFLVADQENDIRQLTVHSVTLA